MDDMLKQIELISKYLSSKLNKKEQKKVEKLLDSNKEFRKMFEIIKTLGIDSVGYNFTELAPSLKKMSLNMFREFNKTKGDRKIMRGLPVFDSQVLPIPQGVRPSVTNSRRLKYKFNDMDMEISLLPVSLYSFELIGQLNDPQDKNHVIELVGKDIKEKTATDELQMFVFAKIPTGKYQIKIIVEEKTKAVVDFKL